MSSQVTIPVSAQDLASGLVGVTEDNSVKQKLTSKISEKYGHSVEIAENGSLAVDELEGRVS